MLSHEMWKMFKSTGNINVYMYLSEAKNIEGKYNNEFNNDNIDKKEKILQGF
ncbi:hypothetical protein [Sporosalibacterium faouarense]|uniref:hypothetical protein n=1 Tax=Sporosalibacterium faouarense TaxID=516123 RepID=UPI00192BE755|nr:hypothetical protein [Sporosalibacterium faouarense]